MGVVSRCASSATVAARSSTTEWRAWGRRNSIHPLQRHRLKPRLCHPTFFGVQPARRSIQRAAASKAPAPAAFYHRLASQMARSLWRSPALRRRVLQDLSRHLFHRRLWLNVVATKDSCWWIRRPASTIIINVSAGHRLGTAQIRSAGIAHARCPKPPSLATHTPSKASSITLPSRGT